MEHLDVLGAGRAAPGVLAVVARPVHICCGARRLMFHVDAAIRSASLWLRLQVTAAEAGAEKPVQRPARRFVRRDRSAVMRYGFAQRQETQRYLTAAYKGCEVR